MGTKETMKLEKSSTFNEKEKINKELKLNKKNQSMPGINPGSSVSVGNQIYLYPTTAALTNSFHC